MASSITRLLQRPAISTVIRRTMNTKPYETNGKFDINKYYFGNMKIADSQKVRYWHEKELTPLRLEYWKRFHEVTPLVVVTTAALGWAVAFMIYSLFTKPDVHLDICAPLRSEMVGPIDGHRPFWLYAPFWPIPELEAIRKEIGNYHPLYDDIPEETKKRSTYNPEANLFPNRQRPKRYDHIKRDMYF